VTGRFIVFEGGDGVGKTTQLKWLTASLRDAAVPFQITHEPGDTPLGAKLRSLLLSGEFDPKPRAEALLYAADKAQHVAEVVRPAMAAGKTVISDRYVDSMIAYQSAGRGLDPDEIERIADWATDGLAPDLTVLLDADPAAAVGRIESKDRLESAGRDFHERVRQRFLDLAAHHNDRYLVLNARDPQDVIAAAVRTRLADFGINLSEPKTMIQ
jgi:dTMP kinase